MQEFIENFFEILEDTERNEVTPFTEFKQLDEWDSMLSLMLIAMVDEKYEKQINGTDIKETVTLEDLFNKINSK